MELRLLREIQREMNAKLGDVEKQLRALRADLNGVIHAQQQLGSAIGLEIVVAPRRASSVPTPIPQSASVWDERW
jgi:hypothetical protein